MSQFLSLLKHRSQRSHVEPNGSSAFFFLIGKDEEGCYVETVDKQQQPVHPNYAYFQGYIAQTLRSIDHLKDMQYDCTVSGANTQAHPVSYILMD